MKMNGQKKNRKAESSRFINIYFWLTVTTALIFILEESFPFDLWTHQF